MDSDSIRPLFGLDWGKEVYVNCAARSPLMHSARDAASTTLASKLKPWSMQSAPTELASSLFARLINANADDIAITPSTSYAITVASRNVPVEAGQKILVLEDQMSSNVLPWKVVAAARGAKVRIIPRPNLDSSWTSAITRELDETTAVVAVGNVHWCDGSMIDLEEVGRHCRKHGAALVVDATQSAGALPLDIARIQPDFLACSVHKWLFGLYGTSFLYSAPKYHANSNEYWTHKEQGLNESHERNRVQSDGVTSVEELWDAGGFSTAGELPTDLIATGRKFESGGRPDVITTAALVVGLEKVLEWGVQRISEKLAPMTAAVAECGHRLGFGVPADHSKHIVGLHCPQGMGQCIRLVARLKERGVHVSARCGAIRVSPHLYNSTDDIRYLCDELSKAVAMEEGGGLGLTRGAPVDTADHSRL
jgi:selenocysteine lyase/cysteine desulfurase